jgi:hypothetical protein
MEDNHKEDWMRTLKFLVVVAIMLALVGVIVILLAKIANENQGKPQKAETEQTKPAEQEMVTCQWLAPEPYARLAMYMVEAEGNQPAVARCVAQNATFVECSGPLPQSKGFMVFMTAVGGKGGTKPEGELTCSSPSSVGNYQPVRKHTAIGVYMR